MYICYIITIISCIFMYNIYIHIHMTICVYAYCMSICIYIYVKICYYHVYPILYVVNKNASKSDLN